LIIINGLQFNEESLLTNNIFKYEQRLKSATNKYIESGAILTTYYNINEDATTVDRGLKDIEQIFGKQSPIRYNQIDNLPLYGFDSANPNNTDEQQVEDIVVEGDCIILPSMIVPKQYDIFTINHLKMKAFFQVTEVTYDSMRVEGFYKIRYRLLSTSSETSENLKAQTVNHYKCDMTAIGTDKNPIIRYDDFVRKSQIEKMINDMITSYRALFYNEKHNCFLYRDTETSTRWFDLCGNEFIAKHSIMNYENSTNVILLQQKLNDLLLPSRYNRSVYHWIDIDAPLRFIEQFRFKLVDADYYPESSFIMWSEDDVRILIPPMQDCQDQIGATFFTQEQVDFFKDEHLVKDNEYEMLIKKFIQGSITSVQDISLYTADSLISSSKTLDVFLYTPIIIYIMRKILQLS
jgi:hypothetical protein